MKHTTKYIAGLIITATILLSASTVMAQEWQVFLGQSLFQTDQLSKAVDKTSIEKNDWLATQAPLVKNTPIKSVEHSANPFNVITFDSEYSQLDSWAPLQTNKGNESFILFSF